MQTIRDSPGYNTYYNLLNCFRSFFYFIFRYIRLLYVLKNWCRKNEKLFNGLWSCLLVVYLVYYSCILCCWWAMVDQLVCHVTRTWRSLQAVQAVLHLSSLYFCRRRQRGQLQQSWYDRHWQHQASTCLVNCSRCQISKKYSFATDHFIAMWAWNVSVVPGSL